MPGGEELVREPRARQSADLLQPHRAQATRRTTREVFVQLKEYDTRRDAAAAGRAAREARALSRRTDLCEGVRQRPADRGADRGPRHRAAISTSSRSSADAGRGADEGHAGHARRREPAERRAHQSASWTSIRGRRSLLGVPTVEFDRAVRLVGGGRAGRHVTRTRAASNTTSWCARRSARAPISTRSARCACRRCRRRDAAVSQLATLEFEKAPTQIQRYNRERAVTINSDVLRGFNTAKVTADVVKQLDNMSWPRGYHYSLGGEAQSSAEAFGGIGTAIIVAVFGIFAILVLEFGNFKSTLIVLTVVPLGVFGGLADAARSRATASPSRPRSASSRSSASRSRTRSCSWISPISCASRACRSTRPSSRRARSASCRSC